MRAVVFLGDGSGDDGGDCGGSGDDKVMVNRKPGLVVGDRVRGKNGGKLMSLEVASVVMIEERVEVT